MKLTKKITEKITTKQLFWIISSVVIVVLPHLPRLPIWFPFLLLAVTSISWLSVTHKMRSIPPWLIILITLTLFLGIIYFQGFSLNRELSVTILTTMTVLKLLETHSKRDAWMVVTLCYFVMLTRFFYSQDIIMMFYLLISVIIVTHSLFVLQHTNSTGILVNREIKQTLKLLITGVPLAALFFLFFPRLGSPIWGSPDLFGQGTTGISDEMSPGSISQLFSDDSTAFRATFDSAIPAKSELYWRGPVLWDFDGQTWRRNSNQNLIVRLPEFKQTGELATYEIELEPTGQRYLFALDYVYDRPIHSTLLPDSQLLHSTKINQLRYYKLNSILKKYNPFEWLSNKTTERLTALPEGYNPQTKQLMNSWKAINSNPEYLINKALNWFATDEFYYSYSPPTLQGNTVDQFLFDTKIGFCEHYASAFTVMMRSAGIPARIVTGYQGGINNGDYLLIKQSDAHAWAEVWIKNKGWLRIDPTAAVSPSRVESGSQALISERSRNWYDTEWYRRIGEDYDAVRHKWNKWVRDYNIVKQKALFEILGFSRHDGKAIAIVLGSIMLLTTFFVVIFLYLTQQKRVKGHYDRIYYFFIKTLQKNGIHKSQNQGILSLSQAAIEKYPQAQQAINEFTKLYIKLRFSQYTLQSKALDNRLRNLIRLIKQKIKQSR